MAAGGGVGSPERDGSPTVYEESLNCLSSLITRRTRADGTNKGDNFDLMFDYLKMLELDGPISQLKVIHVAGTKGKEKTNDDVPMPTYFRFLALLAFKIFSAEQVDVAILEVGLGGKFDATNVVQKPIVCGISSLGYDHMEILGHTLGEIAGEKAGIFKRGVPVYTVPQPEEAMSVLKDKASQLGIPLHVISPLDSGALKDQHLGLDGEHQYINASLAISLSRAWLKETGNTEGINFEGSAFLPDQFVRGLTKASLQGRAQIVPDSHLRSQEQNFSIGDLVFYLDGAHSPESLEVCARWFSHVIREDIQDSDTQGKQHFDGRTARQILLFNCMSVRDPQSLLPRLINTCAQYGVHFHKALFVPNQSVYNKVGSHTSTPADAQHVDLSWQLTLQKVWESLTHSEKDAGLSSTRDHEHSSVFPSLPLAIKWLRENAQQNRSARFQVLVTGSLHLVGDLLKLIKK